MQYLLFFNLLLLIVRLYASYIFIPSGWAKIFAGSEKWTWLGQQMGNLGIHFAPMFWGFAATAAEFLGGISLLFGFGARIGASFLAFTMFVATIMHLKHGDPFRVYSKPLGLMIGCILIIIFGAGSYSVDYWLWNR